MLESSLGLSYSSQTVCIHMYLCEFDETHMFTVWVLANNVSMHGVRCRRVPRDTTPCTLTPRKCVLTSAPIVTSRYVCTSRYLFLPHPTQQHHVWHVVSQSLWHCHAQSVQGVIGGATYKLNEDPTQKWTYTKSHVDEIEFGKVLRRYTCKDWKTQYCVIWCGGL